MQGVKQEATKEELPAAEKHGLPDLMKLQGENKKKKKDKMKRRLMLLLMLMPPPAFMLVAPPAFMVAMMDSSGI